MDEIPRIYHIVDEAQWKNSSDPWHVDTLDSDGFIHCSFRSQVAGTLQRYFGNAPGIAVLELNPLLTGSEMKVEPGSGGEVTATGDPELFPHLYGPLPHACVIRVCRVSEFLPETLL